MTELLTYSSRGSFRKLHTIGKASQWESQFLQQSPNSNIHELLRPASIFGLRPAQTRQGRVSETVLFRLDALCIVGPFHLPPLMMPSLDEGMRMSFTSSAGGRGRMCSSRCC